MVAQFVFLLRVRFSEKLQRKQTSMKQFSHQKYYSLCRFNYVCLSFSYVGLSFNICLLVIQLCQFVFQLCLHVIRFCIVRLLFNYVCLTFNLSVNYGVRSPPKIHDLYFKLLIEIFNFKTLILQLNSILQSSFRVHIMTSSSLFMKYRAYFGIILMLTK